MNEKEIWEKLEEIALALDETLNAKFGRSRDPRVCHRAIWVDNRCDKPDCPLCDALSTMRELIG